MLSKVQEQNEGVQMLRKVVAGSLEAPLLLVGSEGVGKRFAVIEAAREAFSSGDGESLHSVQIDQGVHPDLVVVYPEKGLIGVDAVRAIVEQAFHFPAMATARYVVIDGADKMTIPAANAFLKTLEEPPRTTRFFLLSQTADDVIPTIRSRCGLVRFRPLSEGFVLQQLQRIESDPAKALAYARLAEGSVGQAIQFRLTNGLGLRDKMFSLLKAALAADYFSLFAAVEGLDKELPLGLRFLEHLLLDLVLLPHDPSLVSNVDIAEELNALRPQFGEDRVFRLIDNLRTMRSRMWTKISLSFHLKTSLISAFAA